MKKNILLIDDDRELCEELHDIFEDEGFSVKIAYNGLTGKESLEEEVFDILLLDIKIPGLNGFEILKWLKEIDCRIKIIVLTGRPLNGPGYTEKNHYEENLLKFADAVINKPSHIEDIINKINILLEKAPETRQFL